MTKTPVFGSWTRASHASARLVIASVLAYVTSSCHHGAPCSSASVCSDDPRPRTIGAKQQTELCRTSPEYYDRYAFVSSAIVGDHAFALTEAGHVLRFAPSSLSMTGECFFEPPARAMGLGSAGSALVGFANGRIGRIHADTLTVDTLGEVPGEPRWVGQIPERRQTVVAYKMADDSCTHIGILETGWSVAVDAEPSVFFLDGLARLWIGVDHGEWGGAVWMLDLTRAGDHAAKVRGRTGVDTQYPFSGVYGFLEVDRGRVLFFGGTSHLGFSSAFIDELSPSGQAKTLFVADFARAPTKPDPRPLSPINKVLQTDAHRFIVVSENDVFESDPSFDNWKRLVHLPATIKLGRPDAVGNHAAIRQVHLIGDRLLFATRRDGYILLANGKFIQQDVP